MREQGRPERTRETSENKVDMREQGRPERTR
jgi:hypothetical protein